VLSLRGNNSVCLDDHSIPLLSKDDQMVSSLCSRPGLVDIAVIASAAASGSVIRVAPVHPMLNLKVDADGNFELTPLSYCVIPYTYWRGTITVDIEFICSVFHRCSVVIAYDPFGGMSSVPAMADAIQVLKHWTVTISGNTTTTLSLPWRQVTPWKAVNYPYGTDVTTVDPGYLNGHLVFYVLNPVVSNGSTDGIYMNMYFSCKDIQCAQIEEMQYAIEYTANEYVRTFGEEMAHSIKELASRSCNFLSIFPAGDKLYAAFFTTSIVNCVSTQTMIQPDFEAGVVYRNDLLQFLTRAYVGTRGSITYTVIPSYCRSAKAVVVTQSDENIATTAFVKADVQLPLFPRYGPWFYANSTIEGNYTFSVPMYAPAYFIPTSNEPAYAFDMQSGSVNVFTINMTQGVVADDSLDSRMDIQMCRQAGDDFEFVGFRGFPMAFFG